MFVAVLHQQCTRSARNIGDDLIATTQYHYAGDRLIGEFDAGDDLQRRYVHGLNVDEPLAWYEGADISDRRWLFADERGSVVAVADAAGAVLTLNTYDACGKPGAQNIGRFQNTGQTFITEVGLYYYKARFYDPETGRFLQTDPIGYGDGQNMYAYVGNDPVNFSDPSGMARVCTSVTGSRIPRCINVDVDGDGDSSNDTLSATESRRFGQMFHNFITANNGADVGVFGKKVTGNDPQQVLLTRITSQIVGWSINNIWPGKGSLLGPGPIK